MTISRRDFLAVAGLLGVGGMATGCGEWFTDENAIGSDAQLDGERVIIVGAGAAGMATAHLLAQRGVDFQICLLYTSPSPRDQRGSRMPSSA